MHPAPQSAPHDEPRSASPLPSVRRTTFWSRPPVRASIMVIAFAALMLVTNSAVSALGHPAAALLIGPALAVLVLWLYAVAVRRLERRPVTELAQPAAGKRMLLGALGGLALAGLSIGLIALLGGYQVIGWGTLAGALTVVGMMAAVAVTEEVLFRAVIFRLVQQRWGTWIALAASALLFGLVHLINPGATLWGALTIAVEAGLMLGAAYVATGSLWLPIGLHLGWNVAAVAIFGTIGSGGEAREALLQAVTPGTAWLTGGSFGPEASLISVAVCSVATALLLISAHRSGRLVHPQRPARTRSLTKNSAPTS